MLGSIFDIASGVYFSLRENIIQPTQGELAQGDYSADPPEEETGKFRRKTSYKKLTKQFGTSKLSYRSGKCSVFTRVYELQPYKKN